MLRRAAVVSPEKPCCVTKNLLYEDPTIRTANTFQQAINNLIR
jgi:hypothetical protein